MQVHVRDIGYVQVSPQALRCLQDAQLLRCMAATACCSSGSGCLLQQRVWLPAARACPGQSTVATVCCQLRRRYAACLTQCLSAMQFKGLPASTQVLSLSSARFSARPFPSYMPSAKAELVSAGRGLVFVIMLGGTGS